MKTFAIIILYSLWALPFSNACKTLLGPINDKKIIIQFIPEVDGKPLVLKSQTYINANGDSFNVDVFKFYISNLEILTPHSGYGEKDSYHLIDASDSSTLWIEIKDITLPSISGIQFMVGTDSGVNTSGAMGGDLDPAKGMYWAWNSGFINAKLEGRSTACKTVHHSFEFHIGGYKAPYSTERQVNLTTNYDVSNSKTVVIKIIANVNDWFHDPTKIKLADTNEISLPGKNAAMMADNYRNMFSISSIQLK
jgi:hypothetical protein